LRLLPQVPPQELGEPVGVGVGVGDGENGGVGVGDGVGDGDGDGVGVGLGVVVDIVKEMEQLFEGDVVTSSALGRLLGTLGATGCCLS